MKKDEDLSALFEDEAVSDEVLAGLGKLVNDLEEANKEVIEQEKILKEKVEVARKLSQEIIPATVLGSGFSELKLASGKKVIVTEEVKASIPKAKMSDARQAMIALELASDEECSEDLAEAVVDALFKDVLVIEKPTPEMEQILIDNNLIFDKTSSIHWQTLRKYVKSTEERGQKVPESITVFKYKDTKIK